MKYPMTFMAPEGDAGGAAVAEPPMTPVGELYTAALDKAQGKEPAEPKTPPPAATGPAGATGSKGLQDDAGPTGAPAASGATGHGSTGPAAPAKPASALDAALESIEPADSGATGPAATEDYLKDIPEVLPKDSRKEHWERARGAISKLSETVGQKEKRISELTRDLESAKATPPGTAEEITRLQKQLDEYKDTVVAINVEYDPEHRKKFVEGRATLVGKAAAKLNAFGGKGELIETALGMPEGRARTQAIKEALQDLEPVEQNRVLLFVTDVEKLDDEKAELMKDPQGAWARLQESEKARVLESAKRSEEFKKSVFDTVSKELPKKVFLLREVDPALPGGAEHNANALAMRESAFKLLGPDAKPEELVEAAFWKQAGPKVQELFVAARKELATALGALQKYETADPGYRGGPGPKKTSEEEKLDKPAGTVYREFLASRAAGEE